MFQSSIQHKMGGSVKQKKNEVELSCTKIYLAVNKVELIFFLSLSFKLQLKVMFGSHAGKRRKKYYEKYEGKKGKYCNIFLFTFLKK